MDSSSRSDQEATERSAIQNLSARFAKACEQADTVDWNQFLPPSGDPLRGPTLAELIKTDLEIRWKRSQPVTLEKYVEIFPELGSTAELPIDLLYEEYRVRAVYGDKPDLGSYEKRFPEKYGELQQLLQQNPLATILPHHLHAAPASAPAQPALSIADPVAPAPSRPPSQVLAAAGGYKLFQRLGKGSFGEVWMAEAPGGVNVAVKIISRPIDHQEAQRELQSLELIKQLRHPFLLQTQAYWTQEDRLYIVMELADGSLRDRVKECHKQETFVPLEDMLRWFRESAEALDFLLSKGVMHRDIKPENILLLEGHAKVADFGLARTQGSSDMFSATGCGTPTYMAPEVWRGQASPQVDQYSLAATYAELRLERRLYTGSNLVDLMECHLHKMPDLDPLAEAEQKVLLKALAKDPQQRYASCRAFMADLEKALSNAGERRGVSPTCQPADENAVDTYQEPGLCTGSRPPQQPVTLRLDETPPSGLLKRKKLLVAAGAGVLALAILVSCFFLLRHGSGGVPLALDVSPADLLFKPGEQQAFTVRVQRGKRHGPINLALAAPAGFQVPGQAVIPAGQDSVQVQVQARDDAPAQGKLTVNAQSGSAAQVGLTVKPLDLPINCEKASDARVVEVNGRRYYSAIEYVLYDRTRVAFVLVPRRPRTGDPETFYIMKDKVSVPLFRTFATQSSKPVRDIEWYRTALAYRSLAGGGGNMLRAAGLDTFPALGVHVDDAHRFARWLGGQLPTAQQWDRAAGRFDDKPRRGPFDPTWQPDDKDGIAIDRATTGPRAVGISSKDVSPHGCRDMSGNGLEWTRDLLKPGQQVPLTQPGEFDAVLLRGRGWADKSPLTFDDLRYPESQPYRETSPNIGFRVVIEP